MRPAKCLTWIHLSDLHFGHGKEATPRFDQKLVTAEIIRDAEKVAGELGPPDLVFLTGDIAFSASADKEYAAAADWLDKLLERLKIGRERVLLVPGNHDVDRKKALEGHGRLVHKALRADPDDVNSLLEKTDEMEAIWPKLAAYQKFASGFGSPEITAAQPFWTKRLSTALGPVEAIGLNTALLSFDGTDSPQNLALGLGQLQRALDGADRDALLIALLHHPPGWLRDGEHLRAMLKRWPHLLLCGHVHEQRGFISLPIASRGNVELVAGAGHQDADEEGQHAYAWGRLSPDGLEYYPRAWLKGEMSFLPQRINPPEDQKGYAPKLGEFARFPRAKLPEGLAAWLEKGSAYSPTTSSADSITGPAAFRAPIPEPVSAAPSAAPVVAAFDPAYAYFFVPHPAKGNQVIGREDALLKVREQLVKGRRTVIGQTAAFVGLGGLGKTQLAVEYAHAYKDQYPGGVYWFTADEDLDSQLTRLAVAARWVSPQSEPRVMLEIAKHQIQTRSNCLIVFDNVEELATVRPLLPESSATPHLLITSRVPQVGFDPVPIDRLPDEQSLELLCSESRRSLDGPADREAALRIARQLEGLPLALELAGAYLRGAQSVSWASYADLLESEGVKARGLNDGPLASFTKHNADLYATLRIHESILKDSRLLRDALDLLAWSGSAPMGRSLMVSLLGSSPPALDVVLGEAETLKILKLEQGSAEHADPRFYMHRLVREVRRAEVPLDRDLSRWISVAERLGNWFEERRRDFVNLPAYEAELDHLEAWQGHAERMGQARIFVRLLWLCAYPHYHRGQYRRAQEMIDQAFALFKGATVVDPQLEAHLLSDLGFTLGKLGDRRAALKCLQKALDIRQRALGEEHLDTALSLNNMGGLLGDLGDAQAALKHLYRAADIYQKIVGEKPADVAGMFNNIGAALHDLGNYQKALAFKQRALEIRQSIHGDEHPGTARSFASVGVTFDRLGDRQNALECKQRALAIRLKILGRKHPDVASSLFEVGCTLVAGGESTKAFEYMHDSLVIRLEMLGDRHPHTADTWRSVVRLLLRLHRKADALNLVERDLKKFPQNATLKRLKSEILGKRSAKAAGRPSTSTKSPKGRKR